jgi:hypothetical protein
MSQDQLAQAYARLKSLKENLPKTFEVDQKYVAEYHQILDLLEKASGGDLKAFHLAQSEIHPETSGGNYITGETHYSGRHVCERTFLAMKVDGVLGFFEIKTSPKKKEFGFKP